MLSALLSSSPGCQAGRDGKDFGADVTRIGTLTRLPSSFPLRPQGFRLSGLRFVYEQKETHLGATFWYQPFGLVIDDCAFFPAPGSQPHKDTVAVHAAWAEKLGEGEPLVVRECMFAAGGVEIVGFEPGSASFSRNYFAMGGIHTVSDFRRLVVRDNVFAGDRPPLFVNGMIKTPWTFEISNNTFFGSGPIVFWQRVPARGVVLLNNLLRTGAELNSNVPDDERAKAEKNWTHDHNAFTSRADVFASASDVLGEPDVLSADPAHRDYLRIPADGPLATGGAGGASGYLSSDPAERDFRRIPSDGPLASGGGGDWPAYIGALPPGPAPKEGDWFTRLRERWAK